MERNSEASKSNKLEDLETHDTDEQLPYHQWTKDPTTLQQYVGSKTDIAGINEE